MTFRPFPILTLLTLPALAFLIWLGSWQLDRRAWKAELIAAFEVSAQAAPVDLEALLCRGAAAPGRAAVLEPTSPGTDVVRVYGTGPQGAPGWRLFVAVDAPECAEHAVILAETAFDPLDTARRGADGRTAERSRVSSVRLEAPAPRGPFTPQGDPGSREFYAFDRQSMAAALDRTGAALNPDWWLAADDGSLPGYLTQTPPERHVGYAVTWFLMAGALAGIYLLFHVRAGRLRLRR
jgi:surfeit locus 1 family protein